MIRSGRRVLVLAEDEHDGRAALVPPGLRPGPGDAVHLHQRGRARGRRRAAGPTAARPNSPLFQLNHWVERVNPSPGAGRQGQRESVLLPRAPPLRARARAGPQPRQRRLLRPRRPVQRRAHTQRPSGDAKPDFARSSLEPARPLHAADGSSAGRRPSVAGARSGPADEQHRHEHADGGERGVDAKAPLHAVHERVADEVGDLARLARELGERPARAGSVPASTPCTSRTSPSLMLAPSGAHVVGELALGRRPRTPSWSARARASRRRPGTCRGSRRRGSRARGRAR